MILKISLGHKKLKTRKRTKMKCSAGYCSFEYHTYISVTPNIDFRSCYERCVHQTQFLAGRKTRAARTQDAGSSDARRGRCGRKTRALWTQDAGAVDARRGRCGRKTRAPWTQDAGRRSVKLFLGSTVPSFLRQIQANQHVLVLCL